MEIETIEHQIKEEVTVISLKFAEILEMTGGEII